MVWISKEMFAIERQNTDSYAIFKKKSGELASIIDGVSLVE
jgi:hypothetical protein